MFPYRPRSVNSFLYFFGIFAFFSLYHKWCKRGKNLDHGLNYKKLNWLGAHRQPISLKTPPHLVVSKDVA